MSTTLKQRWSSWHSLVCSSHFLEISISKWTNAYSIEVTHCHLLSAVQISTLQGLWYIANRSTHVHFFKSLKPWHSKLFGLSTHLNGEKRKHLKHTLRPRGSQPFQTVPNSGRRHSGNNCITHTGNRCDSCYGLSCYSVTFIWIDELVHWSGDNGLW